MPTVYSSVCTTYHIPSRVLTRDEKTFVVGRTYDTIGLNICALSLKLYALFSLSRMLFYSVQRTVALRLVLQIFECRLIIFRKNAGLP